MAKFLNASGTLSVPLFILDRFVILKVIEHISGVFIASSKHEEGRGEFDNVSGLHNFREFSQPPSV